MHCLTPRQPATIALIQTCSAFVVVTTIIVAAAFLTSGTALAEPASERVVLDLDLDGNEDTIALLNWSRGSGCGLDWRTMAQLDPVSRSRPDDPLNEFLRANTNGVWTYPDDKDRWYSPVVLRFRGKPYFFGGPGNPVVASFWGGEAREWCKFRLLPQHEAYPPEE